MFYQDIQQRQERRRLAVFFPEMKDLQMKHYLACLIHLHKQDIQQRENGYPNLRSVFALIYTRLKKCFHMETINQ